MHGEEERSHGRSQRDIGGGRARGQCPGEESAGHGIEAERGGGVEEQAREVIALRVHAPHDIVGAEGEPGQRNVVTHVESREHPRELGDSQAAIARIIQEIDGVVPVDEAILQYTEERSEREHYDQAAQGHPEGAGAGPAARTRIWRDQGVRMGTRSTKTRWGIAEFEIRVSLRGMKPGAVISIV